MRVQRTCAPALSHSPRQSIALVFPSYLASALLENFTIIASPKMQHPGFEHENDLVGFVAAVAKIDGHQSF